MGIRVLNIKDLLATKTDATSLITIREATVIRNSPMMTMLKEPVSSANFIFTSTKDVGTTSMELVGTTSMDSHIPALMLQLSDVILDQ